MVLERINGDVNGHDAFSFSEDIVISGISGRFPKSDNMSEFAYNLYNKIDMTDDGEERYKHSYPGHPKRFGKVRNLDKFDAQFFSILSKTANFNDPQGRILLENAYESILDAGVCPKTLVGSNTGVFVGCFNFDALENWVFDKNIDGMAIGGNALFSLANRISFSLGLNGPSFGVDSACSSSLYALDLAIKSIKNGDCDAALVAGTNLILNPSVTNDLNNAGILAKNGIARPFDEQASGYVRCDAMCVVFLQRAKVAKRNYSTVVHCRTNNDGFKSEGPTYPSKHLQKALFSRVYKDLKMDPTNIDYVEAHATGTTVGDPQEVTAIDEVFCQNRKKPLPIGSLKSNIGHAEGAAGICSVAKSILIFENEKLIPNINITKIRTDCPALAEGRLRVVDEVEKFNGSLIAVNSFGVFGANAHVLLKGNKKKKENQGIPQDNLPRLLTWSGRSEEALNTIFDDITKRPLDSEHIALLQSTQTDTNPLNTYRGYAVFQKNEEGDKKALCIERNIHHFNDSKRPIVWIFSGVGSQWCGMGKDLMKVPIIAKAFEKCHKVLEPKGINLKEILTSSDEKIFDNVLNTFIGVAAIQIGLTDVLKALGLEPDFIIGHSVGELGCAYADCSLTAEEMILAAYSRGMAINEVKREIGAMAAIAMGYNELKSNLPEGIEIACHNSADSCTVSGSVEDIRAFVKDIKTKKVLAKEIHSSGIPFHSSYIASSGPFLQKRLNEIIKNPKKRSEKWISTSVSHENIKNIENQLSSSHYHTNNLLNPVLFEEGLAQLPKNAMAIEIAPHALLQPIIQKALGEGIYVSLTKRNAESSSNLLLSSLGRMFQNGIDFDTSKIYPKIKFPVSRGTPMISPSIKWNHSENYVVPLYDSFKRCDKRNVTISLNSPAYEYIQGHTLDGKILFPATAYLFLVWESFAMMMGSFQRNFAVVFEDIRFLRVTALTKEQDIEMTIVIQRGSGRFEIVEGGTSLMEGVVKNWDGESFVKIRKVEKHSESQALLKNDFYKELKMRGYHYFDKFKGVHIASNDHGKIEWNSNWVTFTDCMLQLAILGNESRGLCLPTSIRKITINPIQQQEILSLNTENNLVEFLADSNLNVLQCGGVEIFGLEANMVNRRPLLYDPVLEVNKFVPHFPTPLLSKRDMAKFCTQLALENCVMKKFSVVEIDALDDNEPLGEYFDGALRDLPLITSDIHYLTKKEIQMNGATVVNDKSLTDFSNVNLIIKSRCLSDENFLKEAYEAIDGNGFILSREPKISTKCSPKLVENFQVIACITLADESVFMVQCIKSRNEFNPIFVEVSAGCEDFKWIEELKKAVSAGPTLVYSEKNNNVSGVLGLVNCIRREPNGWQNIRCVFIDQDFAPVFDMEDPFYKSQLQLGLAINVFRNDKWGSYKHLSLVKDHEAKPRTEHYLANFINRGDLSTLTWMNGTLDVADSNENIVEVSYAALNFRDVMIATGRISLASEYGNRIEQQYELGYEYAGLTKNGKRIAGILLSKGLSTHVVKEELLSIDIPDIITMEEAASVPLVYFTVYGAFFETTMIKAGKSILIHAGCGGVGLAAIRVAFGYGLEVFTTVSTKEKREFLLNEFPQLKLVNIGNSRDTSFEQMIMNNTNGRGVDYVLNSLSEEKLQASIRCLADHGSFLEVGKFDMLNKSKIHLGHFMRGISFIAVSCKVKEMINDAEKTGRLMKMIENDIRRGIVKPLKTTVFEASEIEGAFRFLATGKHMGKVLLKMRPTEQSRQSVPISVQPRLYFNPDHSYIIPGGLGGFGLELADWLVLRECKNLVLSSSRGITNSYQAYRINIWKSYGVKVLISTSDITTKSGCEKLISEAKKLGPVGGIFNLAVVLKDGILENQNETTFRESFGPKALATKHLDELSRKLCPELKHFVVFSSVSCGRGNAGQSNYGMANSVMERIVEKRVNDGFAGKAIQWGAIGEVGLVANMHESNTELEIGGTLQQRISSCLRVLDDLLTSDEPIVSSMVVAEKRYDSKGAKNIIETIMRVMGIKDTKSISMDSSLFELGMDSLMGVEIHQILQRDFDCILTAEETRTITLRELQDRIKEAADSVSSNVVQSNNDLLDMIIPDFEEGESYEDTIIRQNESTSSSSTKMLIIPGVEGMASKAWKKFAKKLKQPAFVLQLLKTYHLKHFNEIFDVIIKDVIDFYNDSECFILVGYSFGAMLALKLAGKLESIGKKGKLILIDGSPKFIYSQVSTYIPESFTDDDIGNLILTGTADKIFGIESENIKKRIVAQLTFESKVVEYKNYYYASTGEAESKYFEQFFSSILNRFIIMRTADKIEFSALQNTPMTLLKASISNVNIEDDFGLQKYSRDQIEIRTIEGSHLSILENDDLSCVINELT